MQQASLIRTLGFRASHHYRRAEWSDERNREAFGETAEPHAHDWTVTVTVTGSLDPARGFVVDLAALDAVLRAEVLDRFDGGDLNEAIPEVRDGRMLPSTEAIAGWLFRRLEPLVPGDASLVAVRVAEDEGLAGEARRAPPLESGAGPGAP